MTPQRLNATQLRDLRLELHVERARLQRALETAIAGALANAYAVNNGAAEREHVTMVASDLEARFDSVVSALKRMDDGSYGECAECHETIPYGRLLVMPESTHCVGCAPRR